MTVLRVAGRVLTLLALFLLPVSAGGQSIGVVLMHGKWGSPQGPLQPVESALRGAGYKVIAREMAWSERRAYDQSLDETMADIDRQIAELKAAGAARIVVGGQSFGANMALAYGARHPDVVGVMALAPGHLPERFVRNPKVGESLLKARTLIAEGKAQQFANFEDINQGRTRQVSAKPAVYLSYFDPDGEAVMPRNAPSLGPPRRSSG